MKTIRLFTFVSVFLVSGSLLGQPLEICFGWFPGANEEDTLRVYMLSKANRNLEVRAVNLSFVYQSNCTEVQLIDNVFSGLWSTFLADTQIVGNLSLTYSGHVYDSRWQYGNSDPGSPMPAPLVVPYNQDTGIQILTLLVKGPCRDLLHMESENENRVNQIGNEHFDRMDYLRGQCGNITSLEGRVSETLRVYPDPFATSVNISLSGLALPAATAQVFDLSGRMVFQNRIPLSSGAAALELGELPSGLYLLSLFSPEGEWLGIQKIRKE